MLITKVQRAGVQKFRVSFVNLNSTPLFQIVVSDELISHTEPGRCDVVCDDRIVSQKLAYAAALKSIGRLMAIDPVHFHVAI